MHKQDLLNMHEQHQIQIQTIKTTHKQEALKSQQEIEKLSVIFLLTLSLPPLDSLLFD